MLHSSGRSCVILSTPFLRGTIVGSSPRGRSSALLYQGSVTILSSEAPLCAHLLRAPMWTPVLQGAARHSSTRAQLRSSSPGRHCALLSSEAPLRAPLLQGAALRTSTRTQLRSSPPGHGCGLLSARPLPNGTFGLFATPAQRCTVPCCAIPQIEVMCIFNYI